jgi:hypothetical protein
MNDPNIPLTREEWLVKLALDGAVIWDQSEEAYGSTCSCLLCREQGEYMEHFSWEDIDE